MRGQLWLYGNLPQKPCDERFDCFEDGGRLACGCRCIGDDDDAGRTHSGIVDLGRRAATVLTANCADRVEQIARPSGCLLFRYAVARFGAVRQLLVLKCNICQVRSNGVCRCVLRQVAHASGLLAIILDGHAREFERGYLHGGGL